MSNTISVGYTVAYDKTDGTVGFIGLDPHSGGYPFFSDNLRSETIFSTIERASNLLDEGLSMRSYHGHDKVVFGTMRIVSVDYVLRRVEEAEVQKRIVEAALKKLSKQEIDALEKHILSAINVKG